jgi:hypothetical protein
MLDGQGIAFNNDVVIEDTYAVFIGPSGTHTLEITLGK